MPDIARWNGIDQLAESYLATSPYEYVLNNPINMFDPDGRTSEPFNWRESWDATPAGTNSYWFNNGSGFTSYNGGPRGAGGSGLAYGTTINTDGTFTDPNGAGNSKSSLWQALGNLFSSIFNGNKGAGITTFLPGATVSRAEQIREILQINAEVFYNAAAAGAGTVLTRSLWGLPLMLKGDTQFAANSKLLTIPVDISGENVNKNGILLYRSVSSNAYTEVQLEYNEALFGIAIPNGLRAGNTAHWDMDDHARGDNYSIWTSWTSDPNVARDFATNYGTSSGVVLSKRFKIGVNAIPNVSPTGNSMQEREWLIFGPVIRAGVQHIKP
ncbi:hypothetical protein MP478_02175 [Chryseobacterium sp. WG14]|uniref:hypothetical protein n=1 Tax=Chryseobacterium sp. WG14 TaxID=2926909 RepID=UPI00211DF772|nr:hypothetical protein [Chryseobacterium sp. WG14]MCQ9638180.1 hypothetical protein [Chryseobacterium sp. WG14]